MTEEKQKYSGPYPLQHLGSVRPDPPANMGFIPDPVQPLHVPAGADWREPRPRHSSGWLTCPHCGNQVELLLTLANGTASGFAPNGEG